MRQLTTNQVIALLAIYRGTFDNELTIGTRNHDMKVLDQLGLMVRSNASRSPTYSTTAKGSQLVEMLLQSASVAASGGTVNLNLDGGVLDVDVEGLRRFPAIPPMERRGLDRFLTMLHGGWEPEPDSGKGLQLSDVEGDSGRVNGGTFFVVAEAGVKLQPKVEGTDADFSAIHLAKVDPLIHATEQEATDVAVDRAKQVVGSRHVVLKAVAMHEVAVPIKSVRL